MPHQLVIAQFVTGNQVLAVVQYQKRSEEVSFKTKIDIIRKNIVKYTWVSLKLTLRPIESGLPLKAVFSFVVVG